MVIKITPNNAFHTRSCPIKSLSPWGSLSIELLILLSCQSTLLPALLKAGAIKKIFFLYKACSLHLKKITIIIPPFHQRFYFFIK